MRYDCKKNLFDSLLAIQSSGWLKPVLLGPAGFLFQGKALRFIIQSGQEGALRLDMRKNGYRVR
jgi:hypothetical protein